jgi:hypothetical protein
MKNPKSKKDSTWERKQLRLRNRLMDDYEKKRIAGPKAARSATKPTAKRTTKKRVATKR